MADALTLFLLSNLLLFSIGIVVGWYLSQKENVFTRSDLRIAVGLVVTAVWTASIVAEILIPAYTVSVLIHGIMGAVVGYLFSEDGITFNIGGDSE